MSPSSLPANVSALIEKIDELRPLLLRNGAFGDQNRRVAQESIDVLAEIGAFQVTQPARFGGFQGNSRAQIEVSRAVGRGDGAAAWVVALTNIGGWLTSLFPAQAQHDVWGEDPRTRVSGVLAPNGKAVRVDGGYRVTGRWAYASGSLHSAWSVLGAELVDQNGEFVDTAQLLIPQSELGLDDTWYVAGMRGSGSNTITATDVFVPDYRVIPGTPALRGEYPGTTEDTPGVYRAGWIPVLNIILAGPQIGIGQAVLDAVVQKAASKGIAYTSFERQSDSVAFQLEVAKAALLLEAAEGFAHRATDEIDIPAEAHEYPTYVSRARNRAYVGWIVEHVSEAISILLTAHGSAAFAEANPLQRLWRDQAVAARHAFVRPALGYELYGKALLGRDDGSSVTPLV
ncbi:oxidoreductase [Microbacterium sp. BR1]|uniref:oxidoreductase n=1 Tax=Microbacterium sp. BR1 TaxID=1070896 RepID=UPI000C2B553B|nr:oxidoreductase [Microbacterium sp. BR1]